jgi:hypothetical protein
MRTCMLLLFLCPIVIAIPIKRQLAIEIDNLEKTFQAIDDLNLLCNNNEVGLEQLKDELGRIYIKLKDIGDVIK